MDDQLRPSGSRWEPTPGASPYWSAAEPPVPPYGPAYGDAPTDRARWPVAGRGALAALAAGLVLVSGVGGFAVGRAVAGDTGRVGLVGGSTGQPGGGQAPFGQPGGGSGGEDGDGLSGGRGLGGHDLGDDPRGRDLDGRGDLGGLEGSVPPGFVPDRPGTVPPGQDDQGDQDDQRDRGTTI